MPCSTMEKKPYNYFKLFFDQEVYDLIKQHTKEKMEKFEKDGMKEKYNLKINLYDFAEPDIDAYFAALLKLGFTDYL